MRSTPIPKANPLSTAGSERNTPSTPRQYPHHPAYRHPDGLSGLGVEPGDIVEIASDHSSILGVAEAESNLRRGLVSMPHAFGDAPGTANDQKVHAIGSNTGRLTSVERDYDPYTGIPRMSSIPVNVKRQETAEAG